MDLKNDFETFKISPIRMGQPVVFSHQTFTYLDEVEDEDGSGVIFFRFKIRFDFEREGFSTSISFDAGNIS